MSNVLPLLRVVANGTIVKLKPQALAYSPLAVIAGC